MLQGFRRSIAAAVALAGAGRVRLPAPGALPRRMTPLPQGHNADHDTQAFKRAAKAKKYPFSSTRQNEKSSLTLYTANVNGFEIMQQIPGASKVLYAYRNNGEF